MAGNEEAAKVALFATGGLCRVAKKLPQAILSNGHREDEVGVIRERCGPRSYRTDGALTATGRHDISWRGGRHDHRTPRPLLRRV
jgi:hypothetical protein